MCKGRASSVLRQTQGFSELDHTVDQGTLRVAFSQLYRLSSICTKVRLILQASSPAALCLNI